MKAKNQKTIWRRAILSFLALGLTGSIILSSCERTAKEQEEKEKLQTVTTSQMQQTIASRDSMIEELLTSFDEVDANLEIIREKEGKLRELAANEEGMGKREDRIVRDIQVINTLMADNRDEIAKLREKLRKSGINMTALEDRLKHMEEANTQNIASIEELKGKLAEAETNISGLNETLGQRELQITMQEEVIGSQSSVIKEQDNKMHEAYIATGSYKELRDRGLVDKKGSILGLGGEKEFTAKTDPSEFVTIDQREQVKIPVYSKKVELITPHPEGSYELEKGADGKVVTIDILKPEDFWKSSRYLIVATE